jgi:hypothetical protein
MHLDEHTLCVMGEYLTSLLPESHVLMSSMKGGWNRVRKGTKDWVTLQTLSCKAKAKLLIFLLCHSMIEENRQLVTDEPVEFEK